MAFAVDLLFDTKYRDTKQTLKREHKKEVPRASGIPRSYVLDVR